jgi:O-antigen/teichoic acid export membrane protein
MKNIVAKNTIAQLIGRGISALTTLVITILIARQFGAAGYGDFVKVTTYVAFFYLVADFGVNAIFLQQDMRAYWHSLVTVRIIGSVMLILLSLVLLLLLPATAFGGYTPSVRFAILLFSPTILFQGLVTTANAVFQKKLRYGFATWAIFFGSIATILFVWNAPDLRTVIGAVAVGTFVTSILSFILASRLVGTVHYSLSLKKIKQLLLPSIPLGITLLFNLVYFRADSVVITLTRPTTEVGFYGLAYKVFEVILVFPVFFMNAVYPLMVGEHHDSLKYILKKSVFFLSGFSLMSLAVVWFAAPYLVLIKSDFVGSIGVLRVLALGLPFFFITAATMWGLIALKRQKILAIIYGLSMAINIVGNILLVPSHGIMAAAWMTVVGEGIVLLLSSVVLFRTLHNNT